MNNKLTKNIAYSLLMQATNLLVPLFLSPYVARVLSADLIGQYSYSLANSSYFVLAESLGLSLYGILRIAADRDDIALRSKTFKEIMFVKICLMTLSNIVYAFFFVFLTYQNRVLNAIMVLNIISNGIDTTWFFTGMEDFKAISLRNLLVKILGLLLVVSFVKDHSHLLLYALIMQLSTFAGYFLMLVRTRKYIEPTHVQYLKSFYHIKKSIGYFIPGIVSTIFMSSDKSILGFGQNSKFEVGVYEQATKITNLVSSVISSISNVLLPRATYIYNKNKEGNSADRLLINSVRTAMIITIPSVLGLIAVSDVFVPFFFGQGYEKSAFLIKILSAHVLFVVLSDYIGHQALMSRGKQNSYNIAISTACLINVFMNIIFARTYHSIGVSVASSLAGIIMFMIIMHFSKNNIDYSTILKGTWKYLASAIIMFLAIFRIRCESDALTFICQMTIGAFTYMISIVLLRDEFAIRFMDKVKAILRTKRMARGKR